MPKRFKSKTYRHHRTTARASYENLASIRLVFLQSPFDHVCNSVTVSTSLVAQCLLAANIPTCSRVRRTWIDDNEPMLFGERRIRAAAVVCLSGTSAVVNSNNDAGRCSKLLGHIDIETSLGRGTAERRDLGKSAWCWCALSDSGSGGQ